MTPEAIIALASASSAALGALVTGFFKDRTAGRTSFKEEVFALINTLQADVNTLKIENTQLMKEISEVRVENAKLVLTNEYLSRRVAELEARQGSH